MTYIARVLGDRVQLQQVVLNLNMNALDAVSALTEGPREIVIQTSLSDHHDLLIAVRDSGVGFSEEGLRSIFDPFFTTKPHGIGIGLSISRSIVEAHSGRLWAAGNDDAPGATITFMLPLHEPPHG
jgi:C4-dicarboxylate-specific signal transduction histidine kinase